MTALFSTPKQPKVRPVSPPIAAPDLSAADVSALADEQRNRFFGKLGKAGTLLTGGGGADGGVSVIRFLGGAAKT